MRIYTEFVKDSIQIAQVYRAPGHLPLINSITQLISHIQMPSISGRINLKRQPLRYCRILLRSHLLLRFLYYCAINNTYKNRIVFCLVCSNNILVKNNKNVSLWTCVCLVKLSLLVSQKLFYCTVCTFNTFHLCN